MVVVGRAATDRQSADRLCLQEKDLQLACEYESRFGRAIAAANRDAVTIINGPVRPGASCGALV